MCSLCFSSCSLYVTSTQHGTCVAKTIEDENEKSKKNHRYIYSYLREEIANTLKPLNTADGFS